MTAGGQLKSFDLAAQLLVHLAEFPISGRQVGRLTEEIGAELRAARDQQAAALPPERMRDQQPGPAPDAVAVEVDGGRLHVRAEGQGPGVHQPHWKEDKIACLVTLESQSFATDPHPEPPPCFLERQRVFRLVREISNHRGAETEGEAVVLPSAAARETAAAAPPAPPAAVPPSERAVLLPQTTPEEVCLQLPVVRVPVTALDQAAAATSPPAPPERTAPPAAPPWQPRRVLRTCVATTADSTVFGKLTAAEAYRRNFYAAARRAFVADGQKYNWTIHARHFSEFVGITDFAHALTYVFAAAYAVGADGEARWQTYARWVTACWQGRVAEVIGELEAWAAQHPAPEAPVKLGPSEPREVVRKTLTYLQNNRERMAYPEYRCAGLPCMSAWMESLVKEFNYRVKGSEKFWNDGSNGEDILQVRAAVLAEDGRLASHIRNRPGSPFRRYRRQRSCTGIAA